MEELKNFRNSVGLTLQEFAENIGVSKSLYEKVEGRKKKTKQRVYN